MTSLPVQGGGFFGGLGRLGGILAPDPTGDQELYKRQLQQNALLQFGLGTLANSQQSGATLGGSLAGGFSNLQQSMQAAQQQAFSAGQEKRRQEKEERLEKAELERAKLEADKAARESRQQGATVAQRFATGVRTYAQDPLGYFNAVRNTPEVGELAAQYRFDPAAIETPEQVLQLSSMLEQVGGIGAPPPPREPTEPLEAVIDPKTRQPVLRPRSQAVGATPYYRPSNALAVTLPDGTVISDGPPGAVGPNELTKPTVNKLQETIVNAQDKLDRVNTIAATYKPEFLQARGFIKAGTTRLVDFLGGEVPEEDRKFLSEYSEFRANAARDLNATVKELNGSAVTPSEIQRTLKAEPSEKDSPIEFEAKIRAQTKFIQRAVLRANYALKNGIGTRSVEELSKIIPLEAIDRIYEERVNDIFQELGGTDAVKQQAIRQAQQEFGLAR